MPRRPSLPRRLRTAARWPLGVALTSWRYTWRTTPFHRSEVGGSLPEDAPPPLRPGEELQPPEAGVGPLFHRVYRARIRDSSLSPERVIAEMTSDLDRVAPTEFASFNKVLGGEGIMAVGDEYVVRMPGPWDGPVRVVERTPTSFRFATLDGHLEAGQIEFSARTTADAGVPDRVLGAGGRPALESPVRPAAHEQRGTAAHVDVGARALAMLTGGRLTGGIEIRTRRVDAG